MQHSLLVDVTADEIYHTLKSMPRNKSPGPDGYTVEFFIASWDIIGDQFVAAVLEFFSSREILKQLNSTSLALIPKVAQPTKIIDYRPIACCNIIYKCISKILANRLKVYFPALISDNQSAFIYGRRIMDNILLAQEIIKDYGRMSGKPRCAIKLDLKKTSDSVHWNFVFNVLKAMNFPPRFIGWIQECIRAPYFPYVWMDAWKATLKVGKE